MLSDKVANEGGSDRTLIVMYCYIIEIMMLFFLMNFQIQVLTIAYSRQSAIHKS